MARSAIARIQELETQLCLIEPKNQDLGFRDVVPDVVPEVMEVSREELEAHRVCPESTRKSVAAKRLVSKTKADASGDSLVRSRVFVSKTT